MQLVKVLATKYLQTHKYFTARKDRYQTASGKIVEEYFTVEMQNSACAVAVTEGKQIILVRQYRHPIAQNLIELPGGFVEQGEVLEAAIARELLEETGFTFSNYIYLGYTYANPGVLNNGTHLFLATGGKQISLQNLDDNEEIEIILKPVAVVKSMLYNDEFKQCLHQLCLYKAFEVMERMEDLKRS